MLAASVFHFKELTIKQVKRYLKSKILTSELITWINNMKNETLEILSKIVKKRIVEMPKNLTSQN